MLRIPKSKGLSGFSPINTPICGVNSILVGGLEHFLFFHIIIGNVIIPSDFHIFQRGWNHQPVIFRHYQHPFKITDYKVFRSLPWRHSTKHRCIMMYKQTHIYLSVTCIDYAYLYIHTYIIYNYKSYVYIYILYGMYIILQIFVFVCMQHIHLYFSEP